MIDQTHSVAAPALHIPTVPEYIVARKAFTSGLKALMSELGDDDPATFGKKIAFAQEPSRESCPYAAAIVKDWLDGTLAPTPTVMRALQDMCGQKYEQDYDALADAWEIIAQEPADLQYRYSKALLTNLGMNRKQLVQVIADNADGITKSTAGSMLQGARCVNSAFIGGVEGVLKERGLEKQELAQIERAYKTLHNRTVYKERFFHPSEFSQTLTHAKKALVLSLEGLAQALAEHGYCNNKGKVFSAVTLFCIFSGKNKELPYSLAVAMDAVAAERGVTIEPSCRAVFDQQLRETAELQWQQAIETKSLGGLLKAISNRIGWDNQMMGDKLDVSDVTVKNWQDDNTIPSDKKIHGTARFEDYCELVERWECTEGTPAQASIQAGEAPWFDATKRQQLHAAFKGAIAQRGDSRNMVELPESKGDATDVKLFFSKVSSTQLGTSLPMSRLPTRKLLEGYKFTGPSRAKKPATNSADPAHSDGLGPPVVASGRG